MAYTGTGTLAHTARTAGARFHEQHVSEGHTYLVFEAGQPCFGASTHRVSIDRPALYVVRDPIEVQWRAR